MRNSPVGLHEAQTLSQADRHVALDWTWVHLIQGASHLSNADQTGNLDVHG